MKANKLTQWAKALKHHTYALYLASKDARVSLWVKILIGMIVAYALSPIDLIPDFIPIIGYLDDLILLPFAIWLVIRLIPKEVWKECQSQAAKKIALNPTQSKSVIIVIVFIWLLLAAGFGLWLWSVFGD